MEKIVEEDENITASNKTNGVASVVAVRSENSTIFREPLAPLKQNELPPKGPEVQEFLNELKDEKEHLRNMQNAISQLTGAEPSGIEINKKTFKANQPDLMRSAEEQCDEAFNITERNYKFVAVEVDASAEEEGGDEAEEEELEDEDEEADEDEEGAEEEDDEDTFDPSVKDKRTKFGETNHYCPVSYKTNGILVPGNADIQLKYRERMYRFSNEETRASFLENPEFYLPKRNERFQVIVAVKI